MHEQAAQAERDRHAGQLLQVQASLRDEHAEEIVARESTAAAQVRRFSFRLGVRDRERRGSQNHAWCAKALLRDEHAEEIPH